MSTKRTISKSYDPWLHVDHMNIPVEWGRPTNGDLGLWTGHSIILDASLRAREARCVLAHEIVHAEFDDEPTVDPIWHARREARCDRIAAERLIDPEHLKELATTTDDLGAWALELNVTGWILKAYLREHPDGLR